MNEEERAEVLAGLAARVAGVEASLAAATTGHRDDRERVERELAKLCRAGDAFTALDVDRLILAADPRPYAGLVLASVMSTWARRGDIVSDYSRYPIASTRRSRHGARLMWWRGANAVSSEAA